MAVVRAVPEAPFNPRDDQRRKLLTRRLPLALAAVAIFLLLLRHYRGWI
jgi:hypothetical protein